MNLTDLRTDCRIVELTNERKITDFDCDDDDLNDFFNHDAINYQNQWLGKTFYFEHKQTNRIVCAFSLAADSLKTVLMPNNRRKKVKELVPNEKSLQSYPSFLIGRLGVSKEFTGQGIGSQLMRYIKYHCVMHYPCFGRFLVIDAYNKADVLNFYQKNDFTFVFSTEQQERENFRKSPDNTAPLRTRQMFFDIMRWLNRIE